MIVRGEHCLTADDVVQVLAHTPGNGDPVVGAGAATDLVQQHQRARRRRMQNRARFTHLHHKGALTTHQIVARAHTGEQSVDYWQSRAARRDIRADLREQLNQSDLSKYGALARHVGSGEHDQPSVFGQHQIVRNELFARHHALDHRMAPGGNFQIEVVVQFGPRVLFTFRHIRKRTEHIERRHASRHGLPACDRQARFPSQGFEQLALT